MNKKVVGGLLAVLFVTQMAQTGAILKMQRVASAPRTENITMTPVVDYLDQQAAAGVISQTPEPDEPDAIFTDIWIASLGGGLCAIIVDVYLSDVFGLGLGNPISSSAMYYEADSNGGCDNYPIFDNTGDIMGTVMFSDTGKIGSISASSPIIEAQFKLMILGYLGKADITSKLDVVTQNALKVFQKAQGLPQVGTYGPQTKAAMDKIISDAEEREVTGKMFRIKR
jgi:hypothetical protein